MPSTNFLAKINFWVGNISSRNRESFFPPAQSLKFFWGEGKDFTHEKWTCLKDPPELDCICVNSWHDPFFIPSNKMEKKTFLRISVAVP
jgi:hypothetical protein